MANTKITPHVLDGTLISGHSTVTAADGDFVLIQDISDSNALKKALVSDFAKNTTEEIQDIVGAMFTSNTETNITATYQDGDGTIDLVVAASSSAADDISTGDAAVTIGTSSGAITLDTPSSITLDSDSGIIDFDDDGTNIGRFENSSSDFKIESRVQDKDIVFVGNDGGTGITALTLDMSDAGTAAFNKNIKVGDGNTLVFGGGDDLELYHIADSINVIRGAPGLVLQTDDTSYGIQMGTYSGGETMFKAVKNGAVSLYYDNEEKLGTQDKGIVVASTGSKDVTIGMSNGDIDWHIGIDDSAGDLFRLGKHTGMGNNSVYSVTPAYKHEWQGAHQGDSVGHFRFSNENLGDATNTNCSIAVINGGTFLQVMAWTTLGARIGTRTGGWNSTGSQGTYLVAADATNIICTSGGSPTLANGTAISSDQRLKKDIIDIGDGQLAKINALKPRTFKWKDTRKTGTQEGFIAQEVESVMPEAVEEREVAPDPDDTTRDFGNDIKVLKHEVINARLIKAVQELSAKLEAAEARITTLEG
tara:strand:+ start:1725 stop:3323 length:1599 start_codon:yes stop_codon:yes gene_type:complete